jgi:hypothetical protein
VANFFSGSVDAEEGGSIKLFKTSARSVELTFKDTTPKTSVSCSVSLAAAAESSSEASCVVESNALCGVDKLYTLNLLTRAGLRVINVEHTLPETIDIVWRVPSNHYCWIQEAIFSLASNMSLRHEFEIEATHPFAKLIYENIFGCFL